MTFWIENSTRGYSSQSKEMEEKCKKAKLILKSNFNDVMTMNFFDLIDIDKLIKIKATTLNRVLENECFAVGERNFIRQERRRRINRLSAKESRQRMKGELSGLEKVVKDLMAIRQTLRAEKHILQKEIHDIAAKLINSD